MSVVDLIVSTAGVTSQYRDQFVLDVQFEHETDDISETIDVVFSGEQKAEVIEFINFLREAGPVVEATASEPEDVPGYEKFCNYSAPAGLSAWPSDHNGNYFATFQGVDVVYYDKDGIQRAVIVKESE